MGMTQRLFAVHTLDPQALVHDHVLLQVSCSFENLLTRSVLAMEVPLNVFARHVEFQLRSLEAADLALVLLLDRMLHIHVYFQSEVVFATDRALFSLFLPVRVGMYHQ